MENNKPCAGESGTGYSSEPGVKGISRRKVLKKLILAPVQGILFLLALKARGIAGTIEGDPFIPGGGVSPAPSGKADDIYTPNQPVGKAQGIIPGRVSWVWNPASTNADCANVNTTEDNPNLKYEAWFMDKNTNQEVVDGMLTAGICSMASKEQIGQAWDAVFRFHNQKRGKGNITYRNGEKIYLKLNRTSASSGVTPEYGRREDRPVTLLSETSPQILLSMLRQLVHTVGVRQADIYVGDAMRNIYQDEYLKYHAEFPDVNYLSGTGNTHGRIRSEASKQELLFFSDNRTVMEDGGADKLYTVLEEAEYLINLPSMKGHSIAGITLCAKNHFGTQTRRSAAHLHSGLNNSEDRRGYGYYRVLVDIMGNKHTGEKNLFYLLDALWITGNWNGVPVRCQTPPFSNHWSSSLMLSLDPVAIESVAFDFLRTEFSHPEHTVAFISAPGVDDHLHQAADSRNWPEGITYAPNGDGTPLPGSLGVHEHWNNPDDKQYSRNLGTGNGIELVKIFQNA